MILARRRGFSLLEIVFAVTIAATALIGLQAAQTGALNSAANSINQRAARELARAKLEEILVGAASPDGSGTFENYPNFNWTSRTEDLQVGLTDQGMVQTVKVVIFELTYPQWSRENQPPGSETPTTDGEPDRETIRLSSILPTDPNAAAPAPPPGG